MAKVILSKEEVVAIKKVFEIAEKVGIENGDFDFLDSCFGLEKRLLGAVLGCSEAELPFAGLDDLRVALVMKSFVEGKKETA